MKYRRQKKYCQTMLLLLPLSSPLLPFYCNMNCMPSVGNVTLRLHYNVWNNNEFYFYYCFNSEAEVKTFLQNFISCLLYFYFFNLLLLNNNNTNNKRNEKYTKMYYIFKGPIIDNYILQSRNETGHRY